MNLDLMADKDRTVVQLVLVGDAVGHRPRRSRRLPGQILPAVRVDRLVRTNHCDLAVVPGDGEFTDLGIRGFAASAV